MALKVGITGGIGSGKSVVCDIFRILDIPVFNSDLEARLILETDADVVKGVKGLFGDSVYDKDGKADRKKIASLVFGDSAKLSHLNTLIHPAVRLRFNAFTEKNKKSAYVIQEAAILVESGGHKLLDKLILVSAPENLRLERASRRDGQSAEEINRRSRNQLPEAELKKYADYIIRNDEAELLIPQVLKIHEELKALAAGKS